MPRSDLPSVQRCLERVRDIHKHYCGRWPRPTGGRHIGRLERVEAQSGRRGLFPARDSQRAAQRSAGAARHRRRQRASARNLGTSRLAGFLCGGVNHHGEHHLFPSVPRARLADARRVTRSYCQAYGLPYHEVDGAGAVAEIWAHVTGRVPAAHDRGDVRS